MNQDHTTRPNRRERRALPGWAIDLIRDGVPAGELKARGQRAVWDELGRTALAAVNAGYSRAEWEYEVARPVSKLGLQNRLKADGKERTARAANKSLNAAWDRAQKHARESPAWTREAAREEAQRRAAALLLVSADPDVPLTDVQRDLLVYAANMAARQGSVSVNLPREATAKDLGRGEKAVRLNLEKVTDQGLLILSERGRARTKTRPGKSNVYRLPDNESINRAAASLSRETRQVGPSAKTGGPPTEPSTGPVPESGAYQPRLRTQPLTDADDTADDTRNTLGGEDTEGVGVTRDHNNAEPSTLRDEAGDLRRQVRELIEEMIALRHTSAPTAGDLRRQLGEPIEELIVRALLP